MRAVNAAGLCLLVFTWAAYPSDQKQLKKSTTARAGINTPGIQVPMENLKALAEVPVAGTPNSVAIGEAIWILNPAKESLIRVDGKTNKAAEPITGLHKPCSGLAIGFGSVWVANCGDKTIARIDLKTSKITATLPIGAADVKKGIAITADSAWIMTDNKTTLSRVDPETNKVVSELRLAAGCDDVVFGEKALWVTCPEQNKVLRIDPETNLVVTRIEVSAKPHALAAGENSIWALCLGDGKIDRIDPKTNKVSNTVELGVPNATGNIATGENFVWVTLTGFPITRVDPASNKVVQQFYGGGGGFITVGLGSVWLSNVSEANVWRVDPKRIIATLAE
jgi:virginiamycin B lyase